MQLKWVLISSNLLKNNIRIVTQKRILPNILPVDMLSFMMHEQQWLTVSECVTSVFFGKIFIYDGRNQNP